MTLPDLRTVRLHLRPVTPTDLHLMVRLNGDPEVMRYLLGRAATPEETVEEWAERLGRRTDAPRGLGYWSGWSVDGFAGWWSASAFADDHGRAGLGYRLERAAWGRGLATEGAAAVRDHAFGLPGVEALVASTMAVNHGSRRVLEKVGMRHVRTVVEPWDDPLPGAELGEAVYELDRATYTATCRQARV